MNYKTIITRGEEAKLISKDSILKVNFERIFPVPEPLPDAVRMSQLDYGNELCRGIVSAHFFTERSGTRTRDYSGHGNDKDVKHESWTEAPLPEFEYSRELDQGEIEDLEKNPWHFLIENSSKAFPYKPTYGAWVMNGPNPDHPLSEGMTFCFFNNCNRRRNEHL